jgi:hypothetical protein
MVHVWLLWQQQQRDAFLALADDHNQHFVVALRS